MQAVKAAIETLGSIARPDNKAGEEEVASSGDEGEGDGENEEEDAEETDLHVRKVSLTPPDECPQCLCPLRPKAHQAWTNEQTGKVIVKWREWRWFFGRSFVFP